MKATPAFLHHPDAPNDDLRTVDYFFVTERGELMMKLNSAYTKAREQDQVRMCMFVKILYNTYVK
jgi:hypothetical protein